MNQTAFVRVFGESPIIKLLDFLILERGLFDYSISELSENTGISWITVDRLMESLIKIGIVKKTRKVGTAEMYTLNEENPTTQTLIGMYNMLSKIMIEGEDVQVSTVVSEKAMAVVLNGKEDVKETIRELYK